jgi:1-deoxy-D-xylulose-5-phosphate reductoisomerase
VRGVGFKKRLNRKICVLATAEILEKSTMNRKKRIILLGATGYVGTTVLEEIAYFEEQFEIVSISCHSNIERAEMTIKNFSVRAITVTNPKSPVPRDLCGKRFRGIDGLSVMLESLEFDVLVVTIP